MITNAQGEKETDHAQLIDFQNPGTNDFLVVNQFTITGTIYYESRLAKLDINREEIDSLNNDVEDIIEDEEDAAAREIAKSKWTQLSSGPGKVGCTAATASAA